jgi:hypothetical protein
MQICKITWSHIHDETKIKFSEDYYFSNWVVKADVLKDAIAMLEEEYSAILPSNNKRNAIKGATK